MILFEDEPLLVVNKPAGWNTHAPGPFAGEGLYEWLKHREPRWARLAIIHRLDKETSGVLVFGKTTEANRSLTAQFTERGVRKKYLLLTDRVVPENQFTAVSTILRAGEKYLSRPLLPGGERAETRFTVVSVQDGQTLIEAEPVTGRTHQIRVHAAEHGFPILGDTLYGGTAAGRVYLHAAELALKHPVTEELMTFGAPRDWSADILSARDGRDETGGQDVRAPNARRAAVVDRQLTNAFRLIHGASDGQPGLFVDQLGDYLLAQSEQELDERQRTGLAQRARTYGARGVYHKALNRHVRQSSVATASPQLILGEAAPERFTIRENGLLFELSFSEGYSVGLFLDQRDNRRRFLIGHVAADFTLGSNESPSPSPPGRGSQSSSGIGEEGGRFAEDVAIILPLPWGEDRGEGERGAFPTASATGTKVLSGWKILNTFAYTCGFSVAAAQAGAHVTSLDLSKKYLEWGRRNFVLNGLDPAPHDFIYGDAFDWMRRLTKKSRLFDALILDPPTFSQSKEGGPWRAEKDYGNLVEAALPLLKPDGVLLASTNAAKLEPEIFLEVLRVAVAKAGRKITQQHYVPQPPDFPITRAEPAHLKTVWLRVQ